MRTKTLLLTVALSAASLLSSMAAGITSVNVVGYINVSVPAGFSFIANQLVGSSSKLSDLIPAPPAETVIYTWADGFAPNAYDLFGDGLWENGDITLTPGTGALIFAKTAFTVTFVGEVKQGTLNTTIPAGFSFVSSQVPQEGTVSALGYTPASGDVLYGWSDGFAPFAWELFGEGSGWDPNEPTLAVGQSALLFSQSGGAWNRTFVVP